MKRRMKIAMMRINSRMNINKLLFTAILFVFLPTLSWAQTYTLTNIQEISGDGKPSQDGTVKFEVSYQIQPCTQQLIKIFSTAGTVTSKETQVLIGVAVLDQGRKCYGPVFLKKETLQLPEPFPTGEIKAVALQPTAL